MCTWCAIPARALWGILACSYVDGRWVLQPSLQQTGWSKKSCAARDHRKRRGGVTSAFKVCKQSLPTAVRAILKGSRQAAPTRGEAARVALSLYLPTRRSQASLLNITCVEVEVLVVLLEKTDGCKKSGLVENLNHELFCVFVCDSVSRSCMLTGLSSTSRRWSE